MWSLSEQVLLTDLPPPYTIGEANVAGTDLSRIVRYVGFTSPGLEVSEDRLQKAREVLGFDRTAARLLPDKRARRDEEEVHRHRPPVGRQRSPSRYKIVVSMGYLGGSAEPRRLADGALLYDWCPIKDELFALSDGHGREGQATGRSGSASTRGSRPSSSPYTTTPSSWGTRRSSRAWGWGSPSRRGPRPERLTEPWTPASATRNTGRTWNPSGSSRRGTGGSRSAPR